LHARVFRRDDDIFVEDLGSTNGTYLNGKKVSAASVVRKGDRVQVGRTTLELRK
jgi:pSer/pThr/pTyr-binding forkhead associated (FHA) protein